jgi:hypothetical protein
MSLNNSGFRSFSADLGSKVLAGAAMAFGAMLAQATANALVNWKDKKTAELNEERAARIAHAHGLDKNAEESHLRVVRD